jgi:hypothetical protein
LGKKDVFEFRLTPEPGIPEYRHFAFCLRIPILELDGKGRLLERGGRGYRQVVFELEYFGEFGLSSQNSFRIRNKGA